MLVGEQPGDQEDLAGRPFVGPAGKLLDKALEEAAARPRLAYCHERRQALQVAAAEAAHPPEAERRRDRGLQPLARRRARAHPTRVLVCLGATAAQALLGRQFRVSRDRGVPVESDLAPVVMATVHRRRFCGRRTAKRDCPPRGGSATGRGGPSIRLTASDQHREEAGRATRSSRAESARSAASTRSPRFCELLEPEVAPLDGEAVDEGQAEEEADGEPGPVPRQDQRGGHQQRGVHAFVIAEVHGRRKPTVAAAPDLFSEQHVSREVGARDRSDPHDRDKPDDGTDHHPQGIEREPPNSPQGAR